MIKAHSITQALGDALLTNSRVFLLSRPEIPMRVKKIHWDSATSDLEDEQGRIYRDIGWDDIEFLDDVECHFPYSD